MEHSPLLSVIMSVYNAEKYLNEAVDSILNQTFRDFEFIIIEDCSSDQSLKILEIYEKQDSRITLIKKEQNKGINGYLENLNLGLQLAKGKYIARMDNDDISDPTRFEKQINLLENDPDLFIVGSYLQFIDENGKATFEKKAPLLDVDIKATMYKSIALYHPVIMFRNSDLRYRNKMYNCEDYDLYFQMILRNKKTANIPESLLKYRVLNSSMSRKSNSFIRWSFVEKARSFYKEALKNGKDSYDLFSPDDFSKILDLDFNNTLEDLKFTAIVAFKYGKKEELKIIIKKIQNFYPSQSTTLYQLALFFPSKISSLYSKIISK